MSNPERRLIGCILLDAPQCLPTLRGVLHPEHFRDRNYRAIWLTACKLEDEGWPNSYETIVNALASRRDIADLAHAIHGESAHSKNWRYYAFELVERHERSFLRMDDSVDLGLEIPARIMKLKQAQGRLTLAKRILQRKGSSDET